MYSIVTFRLSTGLLQCLTSYHSRVVAKSQRNPAVRFRLHLKLDVVVTASPRRPSDSHVTVVSIAAARQPEAALRVAASVKVNAEVDILETKYEISKPVLAVFCFDAHMRPRT